MGLDGEIYTTGTIQGGDLGAILSIIQKYGVPLVVATDKKPVPESVKKIASLYGAKIYEPDHVPSDAEKEDLIKELGYKVSTIHERDALYSALSFYRKMLPKFTQIESIVNKLGIDVDLNRIRSDLIKGLDLATIIENIFAEILSEDKAKKDLFIIKDFIKEYVASENRLKRLEEEYHRLLSENTHLRSKISDLEKSLKKALEELDSLKREFKHEVYRDRELNVMLERLKTCQGNIKELEARIKDLETILSSYKKILMDLIENRYIPIKKISEKDLRLGIADLSKSSISLRGDLNLILLSEGVSRELVNLLLMRSSKNKLVLATLDKCFLNCLGDELNHVCCVSLVGSGIEIIDLGEYILVRSEDLDKIYAEYKEMSRDLPRRIIYSMEELMKLIDEYRSSRKS
jgi:predicted RNase H-like nuclease (RuvC/YqgF family)